MKDENDPLAGNPCPFLRALVEHGSIESDPEPIGRVGATCDRAFGEPSKKRTRTILISLIALVGNGFSPVQLIRNSRTGLAHSRLRNGPLDKRGAGTRILDATGTVDLIELDRFASFASDYQSHDGTSERGLGEPELTTMMDANYTRAAGRRRRIDRQLMNAEWPVLLDVMGKGGPDGTYLAVEEVRTLLQQRQLPDRVVERLR
ncbi:MAG: hypothetical protein AAF531_22515 [Actinomycetota bacterium]